MKKQTLYFAAWLSILAMPVSGWAQEGTPMHQTATQTMTAAPRTLEDYRALALKHNKTLGMAVC